MKRKRRRRSSRRRQQVLRRMILLGILMLMVVCVIVSCRVRKERTEAKEAVKTEQQAKKKQDKAKEETPKQKLTRVKKEAELAGYPQKVVDLLDMNEETVDFVADYGDKKDSSPAEDIGDSYEQGTIPLLIQWDERWGYSSYGTSIIAVSGCGPTCMAMVASGLNNDPTITPAVVAAYGTANGYVDEDNNTYWAFMKEAASNWNLSVYDGMLSEAQVSAELSAGHPIICSVGPGDFTQNGHFIVLTGYENGEVTVNDPFSNKNSSKTWVFSEIVDQIRAMWVYSTYYG